MIKHKDGQYSKVTPNGFVKVEYGAHGINTEEEMPNE
jgi:hypothetical protein